MCIVQAYWPSQADRYYQENNQWERKGGFTQLKGDSVFLKATASRVMLFADCSLSSTWISTALLAA